MSEILSAKSLVETEVIRLKERVSRLNKSPLLKVILVGNNPSSMLYVNNKLRFCKKINAMCDIIKVKEDITKNEFIRIIRDISQEEGVTGLLVQLPLPEHISDVEYNSIIPSEKDVDGFTEANIFSLYNVKANSNKISLPPCTPAGIVKIAEHYGIEFEGKNVVIIGRSLIVGKPLSLMLLSKNATVTVCHSKTKNLKRLTLAADIIISAMGKPHFINKDYISKKNNQIIIDVGISRLNNKTVGDVKFEEVKGIVRAITPVPGGIGPMTILSLANNLVTAAEFQNKNLRGHN